MTPPIRVGGGRVRRNMTHDTFKAARERVRSLVADSRRHEADCLSAKCRGQGVRKDFIDEFWIASG